jgi:hypothetical protein
LPGACLVNGWIDGSAGKPTDHSFTVYLQPLMTLSALLRISVSWVLLLFILFSMAMGFTWALRRFMNRHK